jgi:hypothetical protein
MQRFLMTARPLHGESLWMAEIRTIAEHGEKVGLTPTDVFMLQIVVSVRNMLREKNISDDFLAMTLPDLMEISCAGWRNR